jgi:hypothetical protein
VSSGFGDYIPSVHLLHNAGGNEDTNRVFWFNL